MKKLLAISTILFFLAGNFALAQEGEKKKETGNDDANIEMNVEITMTIMMRMLEKADLSPEQSKKIEDILTKSTRNLVLMRRKEDGFLNKEQKELFNKAKKMAQRAKLSAAEQEEYALKKLDLPKEKMAEFKKLKAEIVAKNNKMNDEISAVLSDEQRAKIPMLSKKKEGSGAKEGSAGKEKTGAAEKAAKAEKDN